MLARLKMIKTWDEIRAEKGKVKDWYADDIHISNPMKRHQIVSDLIEHEEVNMKRRDYDKVHY
jgi:hypothetical protein